MTFPLTLIDLAGAIALLLWGSHMVQTGVQRAFGPRLKNFLGVALAASFLGLSWRASASPRCSRAARRPD